MLYRLLYFLLVLRNPKIKFGNWADREDVASLIIDMVGKLTSEFPHLVESYTSISLNIPNKLIEILPWQLSLALYYKAQGMHAPKRIPLLMGDDAKKSEKKNGWEYPGRTSVYWTHLLAQAYGWSVEYIRGLDINKALALMQEVMTDEQLRREFLWSMSEIAYPYNSSTKTSKFNPLPRPPFMFEEAPVVKMVKIDKKFMPVGVIVDTSGTLNYYETKAKEQSKSE